MTRHDPHAPGPGRSDSLAATLILLGFVGYLVAASILIDVVMGAIAP